MARRWLFSERGAVFYELWEFQQNFNDLIEQALTSKNREKQLMSTNYINMEHTRSGRVRETEQKHVPGISSALDSNTAAATLAHSFCFCFTPPLAPTSQYDTIKFTTWLWFQ